MRPHLYFNQKLFDAMSALLVPSEEWIEQMNTFDLDSRQQEYAQCIPEKWSRIKGVAGSGKTLVIAQKAINCYEYKKKTVLILIYNITLRNYIRDRIAQNTRYMSQYTRENAFEIIHYDAFLSQVCKKIGLKAPKPFEYKTLDDKIQWEKYHQALARLLISQKEYIKKCGYQYETILIDEAQDYESEWFSLIEQVFLAPNAEFMVVADEKQNLYERELENKLPAVPGFRGPWKKLERSYRLSQTSFGLARDFQRAFMMGKYDCDFWEKGCLSNEEGRYYFIPVTKLEEDRILVVCNIVNSFRQDKECISPNDICILLNDIGSIRKLEQTIKYSSTRLNVLTMCETEEEYRRLRIQQQNGDIKDIDSELEKIRSVRKFGFNMNSGTIKICTIHSFKGWEIGTVVLVLDNNENINDEMVYTAITRAKKNIIIISFGNKRYDAFFSSFSNDHAVQVETKKRRKEM